MTYIRTPLRRLRRKRTIFIDCSGSTMMQRPVMIQRAQQYRGPIFGFHHEVFPGAERDLGREMGGMDVPALLAFLASGTFTRPVVITDEGLTPKELNALAELGVEFLIVPVP